MLYGGGQTLHFTNYKVPKISLQYKLFNDNTLIIFIWDSEKFLCSQVIFMQLQPHIHMWNFPLNER